jgi:WD40 repeat protein
MSNHTMMISSVKWGGEGLIYSASRDATISAWDAADGKLVRVLKGHGHWVNTLALSSEYALRAGPYDHRGQAPAGDRAEVHKVGRRASRLWTRGRAGGGAGPGAGAPGSGRRAACPGLQRRPLPGRLPPPPQAPNPWPRPRPCAAQAAAQKRYDEATGGRPERLVSGSDDYTMFLWTPSTSKAPLARLTGHVQLINQVTFSPDGRWLISASFDKSVKLWDGLKGTFLATFRGHVGPVYQVAWSSDSRLFVSGSKDSTLKVWDVRTRKLKVDLPGHADEVFTVDWAPDGASVASGGKDRVLKLWRH